MSLMRFTGPSIEETRLYAGEAGMAIGRGWSDDEEPAETPVSPSTNCARGLPSGRWHLRRVCRARHRRDPSLCTRSLLRNDCRSPRRRDRSQSQRFAHFGIELRHRVFVFLQEGTRILASLPDALSFVAEPRSRLLQDILRHRQIEQVAFARNPFAIKNVELGFAKRRCDFVLHDLDPRARARDHVSFFNSRNAPDVNAHRRIALQRASALV